MFCSSLPLMFLMNTNEGLRSRNCVETVHVRFVNKSNRAVDVLWVNYVGFCVKYKTLNHNEFMDINTYATHPWICLDSTTGDRMLINNKDVFYGDDLIPKVRKLEEERGTALRVCVGITYPLFDLKRLCLMSVRNSLGHVDKIKTLEIPRELKMELLQLFLTGVRRLRSYGNYMLN